MKAYYDDELDALYIQFGNEKPEGVLEIDGRVSTSSYISLMKGLVKWHQK